MDLKDKNLQHLKLLFQFVGPGELKDNLNFLLLQYLMREPDGQKTPEGLYENLFFLFEFLNKMETGHENPGGIRYHFKGKGG